MTGYDEPNSGRYENKRGIAFATILAPFTTVAGGLSKEK